MALAGLVLALGLVASAIVPSAIVLVEADAYLRGRGRRSIPAP